MYAYVHIIFDSETHMFDAFGWLISGSDCSLVPLLEFGEHVSETPSTW